MPTGLLMQGRGCGFRVLHFSTSFSTVIVRLNLVAKSTLMAILSSNKIIFKVEINYWILIKIIVLIGGIVPRWKISLSSTFTNRGTLLNRFKGLQSVLWVKIIHFQWSIISKSLDLILSVWSRSISDSLSTEAQVSKQSIQLLLVF